VALVIASQAERFITLSRRDIAGATGLSVGEVSNCYKRLNRLRLIAPNESRYLKSFANPDKQSFSGGGAHAAPPSDVGIQSLWNLDSDTGEPPGVNPVAAQILQCLPTHRLNTTAMSEFLAHGVRWYSQPEPLGYGRGMPTGWNCPGLASVGGMIPRDVPLAWPAPAGNVNGELISPIHPCAVHTSLKIPFVYAGCAVIDIMRTGRPREVAQARDLINTIMRRVNEQQIRWLQEH
jgi:hypothetical protein